MVSQLDMQCKNVKITNTLIQSIILNKFLSLFYKSYMVATGQEIVREFHFESGKIYIFEKSQGKVKF